MNKQYWICLDKTNFVVAYFETEKEAKDYCEKRPYLKYQKL